jgi:hypothetical protein
MSRTCEKEECSDEFRLKQFARLGREEIRHLIVGLTELCGDEENLDTGYMTDIVLHLQRNGLDKLVLRLYNIESDLIKGDYFKE